ncbi:MAG: ribosomal RNA small subunit methyltransferase A [Bacteriovoracaceae bacterium]|jgi:16S rRNA (adenine1518-N6/adenine1519-N6)-dimethyltransferase|nr:ribosomal RNA small subunit methyltransferase A [Bacteriovoracaceae bacterium]
MSNLPFADKKLGQHFLRDQRVIDQIVTDHALNAKFILEVGPGPGILTKFLCMHKKPIQVLEKDSRMVEYLREFLSGDQMLITDALEVDLNSYLMQLTWDEDVWLVSNLPYNVGVPLLINFIQAIPVRYMTLMFQKEVGEKVLDISGCKNSMGSLMALTQNYFDVKFKCPVMPDAFVPPPKVDSVVISLKRKEIPEIPLSEFRSYEKFLRKLFAHKRKQVGSVLKNNYEKEEMEAAFEKVGLDRTKRAEFFTLSQVQDLYKLLTQGSI